MIKFKARFIDFEPVKLTFNSCSARMNLPVTNRVPWSKRISSAPTTENIERIRELTCKRKIEITRCEEEVAGSVLVLGVLFRQIRVEICDHCFDTGLKPDVLKHCTSRV